MTDQARAAREDLAFMKELAEDRGPAPSHFGEQIFWPGLLYGLNIIYAWVGMTGAAPWPDNWYERFGFLAWGPATAVYLPLLIWFGFRGYYRSTGLAARMFTGAWSVAGFMCMTCIAVLIVASYKMKVNYAVVWPSIAMTIYGSAWLAQGILRRHLWLLLLAAGCCVTAVVMAFLVGQNEMWLVMGLGLLAFMALPGGLIMRRKVSS
ncbi:MAG TPA: hypothetical protein VGO52_04105 [Hyphomonadaceae bacterium]|jgi:hypothetical protein|nr:hypothetical protein [Hyphomonadaceae bacterium]